MSLPEHIQDTLIPLRDSNFEVKILDRSYISNSKLDVLLIITNMTDSAIKFDYEEWSCLEHLLNILDDENSSPIFVSLFRNGDAPTISSNDFRNDFESTYLINNSNRQLNPASGFAFHIVCND